MYVTKGGGAYREQDYAISNQHWVCEFEEIGWNMFLRKTREIMVLCRIN